MNYLKTRNFVLFSIFMCTLIVSAQSWPELQAQARTRKREVVVFHNGDTVFAWPKNKAFSLKAFHATLDPINKSNADTVIYCPIFSFGFGVVDIPSVDPLLRRTDDIEYQEGRTVDPRSHWMASCTNVYQAFLDLKTDPLAEVITWGEKQKREVFVALSANSSGCMWWDRTGERYDFAKPPPPYESRNFLFAPFKEQHPELMFGGSTQKNKGVPVISEPPFCRWSGLDYGQEKVRERFFQIAKELCEKYPVDGLCIDFTNEPQLFRAVAWGGKATPNNLRDISQLMARIRDVADKAGRERNRPIMLAVRVPDSVQYCRAIGIDIEAWINSKRIDMVIGGSYVQLNTWDHLAMPCKRNGVKYYASLDESGIRLSHEMGKSEVNQIPRWSIEAYAGRAQEALMSAVDGVAYPEHYAIYRGYWHYRSQIPYAWMNGSREGLKFKDKRYFVTARGDFGHEGWFLQEGAALRKLPPELSPHSAAKIKTNTKASYVIDVWDDLPALARGGVTPTVTLVAKAVVPQGMELEVSLNGRKLEQISKVVQDITYTVPATVARPGKNMVDFRAVGRADKRFHSESTVTLSDAAINIIFADSHERKQ